LFKSDGNQNKEIDTRIGKANAVMRELHRFVISKRELQHTAKHSAFKSVFVPILNQGHESLIMVIRMLPQAQPARMGYLRRARGVTSQGEVRSSGFCKALSSGGLRVLRALCKKHYAGPLQRGINKSLQRDSNSNIHKLQYR